MNLKTALLLVGGVAASAIVVSAAAVLTGSGTATQPEAHRLSAAAVDAEKPAPDPGAQGIIIATSANYYYWLDPTGERGTIANSPYPSNGLSADGRWQAGIGWRDEEALLVISDLSRPGQADNWQEIRLPQSLVRAEWAPKAPLLAALHEEALYLIDPLDGELGLVAESATAYAWGANDRLFYATQDASGARLMGLDERGQAIELAALSGPVERFYVSPEHDQVVYTQDDAEGWRLLSLDPADGAISDYGNLGRAWLRDYGNTGFEPVTRTATVQAPQLAIAWSPSGRELAVGPVSEPYVMHIIEPDSKWTLRSYGFEEGYAGEMVWSPDGAQLAISTYSPDRTRHEVYVMDVAAYGTPRHLLDGCKIVWSPDGQFLAVKREPHDATGVAAIRVDSGYHWPLATEPQFVPLAWGSDMEAARTLIAQPVPYAVQLGK